MPATTPVTPAPPSTPTISADDIQLSTYPGRVRAEFNGLTLADSSRAVRLTEGRLEPVFYFPPEDVRMDLLETTERHSYCPFRGQADYWSLKSGGEAGRNLAWSYPRPFEDAREISAHLAFYPDRVQLHFDNAAMAPGQARAATASRHNPLIDWLLSEAASTVSTRELIQRFARALGSAGIPVWRFWLSLRTLHPQLYSTSWTWQQGEDDLDERTSRYEMAESDAFRNSPIVPILEGAGGLRRRLDIEHPQLDYPIVRELHADGATDYVAMPFLFSDGQINVLSLTSKNPGGFSAEHLGYIYEILPLLSRLLEVHAARAKTMTLLETYLGKQTGCEVLDGRIRRGDGRNIHAVIWFCDLRNSTTLSETLSREDFLALLNCFFDCLAGSVLHNGGEVLRFIGDAALAIFPIQGQEAEAVSRACASAIAAARDARLGMDKDNAGRAARGLTAIDYGIGLHVGEVTYGNIGTANRLEFTVIGAAANEAARIEGLCKSLGRKVLISGEFAHHTEEALVSMGCHELRGVSRAREIFALAD